MPVVEPKDKLIEIDLKVLCGNAMIDTDNRPLKQGPEVLHTHCMDVSVDERFGMTDGFMPSATSGLGIALEFISNEQFSTDTNEGIKKRGERIGFEVLDDLGHNVTASLLEPHDDLFAWSTTTALPAGLLATDVSVVSFDDTTELIVEPIPQPHSLSYLHTHAPSALVGDSKGSLKLFSGDTFLGITHQPDGDIPLLKGYSATMEDRSCGYGELVTAGGALPYFALFDPVRIVGSALGTSDTVGPALGAKEDLALVLGGEPFLKLDDVHDSSFWNHYSTSIGLRQGDKAFNHYSGLRKMAKEQQLDNGECAYCGHAGELTREHVIPKCLFVPPYPPNLITVPVCDRCNNEKSKDDDFLRDFLVVDIQGSQSPVTQTLFSGKVQRSLSRNSSALLRDVIPQLRIAPLYTSAGIYLGDAPQAPFDGERLKQTLGRIVRGLYFDARKMRLPNECSVEVYRPGLWNYNEILQVFRKLHVNGPRVLGNVFGCLFAAATEDPFFTLWALWFYERVLFTAVTEMPPVDGASPNNSMQAATEG